MSDIDDLISLQAKQEAKKTILAAAKRRAEKISKAVVQDIEKGKYDKLIFKSAQDDLKYQLTEYGFAEFIGHKASVKWFDALGKAILKRVKVK